MEDMDELYYSLGDFHTRPVDIMTFVHDRRFLGQYFNGGLFPYWEEFLKKVYPSPYFSPYGILSLRGSIGQGKSTIAAAGILYDLHKLLCMNSPQDFSGLIYSEKIIFMIFNVTKALAEGVMWDKLTQMMQASPYFSQFFDIYKKRNKEETLFPSRIDFGIGSRIPDSLGKNVVGGALDELNFGILNNQMYNNFNSLVRRMQSRFLGEGGRMPARLWIISSEAEDNSVMNTIVDQYKNDEGVLVVQESIWKVQSHKHTDFPEKSFWVFIGSDTRGSEIITEKDIAFIKNPELCIQVPERYRSTFDADVSMGLRDLAGISTGSSYKLFKIREKLTEACGVTPIFQDSFQLSFSNVDDQIQSHCLLPQYFTSKAVNKRIPRYIHLDVGLTNDRFGIACSYVKDFSSQVFYDEILMKETKEEVPVITTEWAFGIEPETGQEVPLFKAEAFIKWLSKQGFFIKKITADGYQSKQILQNLRTAGYLTEEVSLDRSAEPYFDLRTAVYRGLSTMPNNQILKKELDNLLVVRKGIAKKWAVDHPEKNTDGTKGFKDVSDATCGSQLQARLNAFTDRGIFSGLVDDSETSKEFMDTFWPDR